MLFGRQVILRLGPAGQEGREFRGLRVSFDIKMSTESTPNEASIKAYNLSAGSIELLQDPTAVIELWVGYDVPRLLFRGNPVTNGVKQVRQGVDRILNVEAKDGGYAYNTSRVNLSFLTATTLSQVLTALSAQLGLPAGTIRVPTNLSFPQGWAFCGTVRDAMSSLAASTGSQWFITDGALSFIGESETIEGETVLFSPQTGLIGSPAPKEEGVEVTALLQPGLRPGQLFQLASADYNGWYKATDVQYTGDSGFDTPFYVKTVGTPVSP